MLNRRSALHPPKLLICGLIAASLAEAQTTWNGAGADNLFSNTANWTADVPDSAGNPGFIGPGADVVIDSTFTSSVTQTGGNVDWAPASAQNYQAGSVWNLNGGTFDLSNTSTFILNGSTFNVSGGTLTSSSATTSEIRILTDANFNVTTGVSIPNAAINHRNGDLLIDGVTLTAGSLLYAINGAVSPRLTVQNGGSFQLVSSGGRAGDFRYGANNNTDYGQVVLGSGVNSIIAESSTARFNNFQFDFGLDSIGSSISIGDSSALSALQWESQWIAGELTVAGSNSGSFADYFTVGSYNTDGTTLTLVAVPEPSAYGLFAGILGLASVAFRRRK